MPLDNAYGLIRRIKTPLAEDRKTIPFPTYRLERMRRILADGDAARIRALATILVDQAERTAHGTPCALCQLAWPRPTDC